MSSIINFSTEMSLLKMASSQAATAWKTLGKYSNVSCITCNDYKIIFYMMILTTPQSNRFFVKNVS